MRTRKNLTIVATLLAALAFTADANADHVYRSHRTKMLRHARTLRNSARDFERRMRYVGISPYELKYVCALEDAACELEEVIKCDAPFEKLLVCYGKVDRLVCWIGDNLAPTCPVTYNRSIVRSWECICEANKCLGEIVRELSCASDPYCSPRRRTVIPPPAYDGYDDRFAPRRSSIRFEYRSNPRHNRYGRVSDDFRDERYSRPVDPRSELMRILLARMLN